MFQPFLFPPSSNSRENACPPPSSSRVVILEFPTFEAAKAWHDSPAYQQIAEHRYKGGDYRCIVVEGG